MKPGDFFLGVTDFFSILLPGAALTFIALFLARRFEIPPDQLLGEMMQMQSTQAWAAFGVVSYASGHLIASLGSQLDAVYDNRKDSRRNQALRDLADTALLRFLGRAGSNYQPPSQGTPPHVHDVPPFAWLVSKLSLGAWAKGERRERADEREKRKAEKRSAEDRAKRTAERAAKKEKRDASDSEDNAVRVERPEKPVNAYKLARLTLSIRAPTIYTDTIRIEADSKFFRSMAVVATLAVVPCVVQLGIEIVRGTTWPRAAWGVAYLASALAVLRISFVRFCELRLKATETAFQGLLVVMQLSPTDALASLEATTGASDE